MSGTLRENVGKKDAKKQRREGKIPCVLYGGKEQVHFSINEKDFKKIIFTPDVYILNIKINGTEFKAILQDVQYHPVTDKTLHADFLEVIEGKPIITALPVMLEGSAPGVLQGGILYNRFKKLKVKGLAENLPDNIVLNIAGLEINDSIRVRDLDVENVEFLDYPNSQIVAVKTSRGAGMGEEEEEEEEALEEGVEGEGTEKAEGEGTEKKEEGGEN